MKGLLFTYALTYGGSVVALFNPYVGLLIYVCFSIIKPDALWFWSVPAGNYSRTIAIALLIGWLGKGLGDWRFGRAAPIVRAFIGYWLWMVFCSLFAQHNPAAAMASIEAAGKILLPFLAGLTLIRSIAQLELLAWVMVVSQAYVAYDLNVSYYSGYNRMYFAGFAGLDNNCIAISMVTGTGLALFLGLNSRSWIARGVCIVASVLMMHCTMFGFSRGGMLALCITGAASFWLIPKRPIHYLMFLLVVVAGLRLAGAEVRERFAGTFADESVRDASAQSRLDLWKNALDTMQKSPLVGVGPDQWGHVAPQYGWPRGKRIHSIWLQTGAELGYPGMLLLLGFYVISMVMMFPIAIDSSSHLDPTIRALSSAVFVSLLGFVISAQFVSLTQLELPYYINLIAAGLLRVTSVPMTDTVSVARVAEQLIDRNWFSRSTST
jgi:putative inorganic carbon (HCO3(-)) transporter